MNPSPASPPDDYCGFADLTALRAAHARRIQQQGETPLPADFLETVDAFVIRAQATGRVLGDDEARTAAQTIIDYWVTVLLRGRRTPPETGLAEYGFHAPMESIRERPTAEYLTDERVAIRKRLRLSAAAAQWNDGNRDRGLLWGGAELHDADKYSDLTELEKNFIAAGFADERRAKRTRRRVITAATLAAGTILTLIIGGLYLKARSQQRHALDAERLAREAQHQLALTLVERAAVRLGEGDVAGSVAWLAQALRVDTQAENPQAQATDRLRLGAALAQLPKLDQFFLDENPDYDTNLAKWSDDGKWVLTVANLKDKTQGAARLYNADTGAKRFDFPETKMSVNDASFCAHGRIIVTAAGTPGSDKPGGKKPGGATGRVRFWQSEDGKLLSTLPGVERVVQTATPSPGGDLVALVFEQPASIELRSVPDGQLRFTRPWSGRVKKVAFSLDGKLLAACGSVEKSDPATAGANAQSWVRVWDAATGAEITPKALPLDYDLPLNTVAFSPDSQRVVTAAGTVGAKTAGVEVRDFRTGERIFTAQSSDQVATAEFSPDGQRAVTASDDETARVFDASTGRALLEFKHDSSVRQAAYSPDGRFVASGSRDHTARVWCVATGGLALPPLNHGFTVSAVAFSPDGERLLTTAPDGARSWLLHTAEPLAPVLQLHDPIWNMAIGDDGRRVVAVSQTGKIGRWDLHGGEPVRQPLPALLHATAIFFSDDATHALIVTKDEDAKCKAKVSNLDLGTPGPEIPFPAALSCAVFNHENTRLLIATGQRGHKDGTAAIFDAATGQPIGQPLKIDGTVTYAVFSKDDRHVLTASGIADPPSGAAQVWDAATGEAQTPPLQHLEEVTHASFNPALTRVVTASVDDTAKIWDIDLAHGTARQARWLREHTADLTRASFSPDGKYVVTASFDRSAVLWDAESDRPLRVLEHPGAINDAQFDPDGRYLVTACADRTVRVWAVPSGDWISLFRHDGEVTRAFFTPKEHDVITLSSYEPARLLREAQRTLPSAGALDSSREQPARGTMLRARIWRLPAAAGSVDDLERFAQLLLSRKIESQRDLVRLDRKTLSESWGGGKGAVFQTFKTEPQPRLHAVEESEATGEWFAARWHLDRLLAVTPDDRALLIRRGLASANLRDWEKAAADYEKALGPQPDADLLKSLARAQIERGDFARAIDRATQALRANSEDRDLYMLRAEAYAATQRWDEAAADLDKANALPPKAPAGYTRLGTVRLKQNRPADYAAIARKMVELFGQNERFAGTAAWACVLRPGSVPDPAKIVQLAALGVADNPRSFYRLNTLGAALYRAGDFPAAIEKLADSRAAYMQAASAAQLRGDADASFMPLQDGRAADWLFLAMAHNRLGHGPEAREWLTKSRDAVAAKNIRDPRRTWHHLELELLLEEATALIGDSAAAP